MLDAHDMIFETIVDKLPMQPASSFEKWELTTEDWKRLVKKKFKYLLERKAKDEAERKRKTTELENALERIPTFVKKDRAVKASTNHLMPTTKRTPSATERKMVLQTKRSEERKVQPVIKGRLG